MSTPAVLQVYATSDPGEEVLALLLDDPDWVAAEFQAVMQASGFEDDSLVAVMPPLPGWRGGLPHGDGRSPLRLRSCALSRSGAARVRSPPIRR